MPFGEEKHVRMTPNSLGRRPLRAPLRFSALEREGGRVPCRLLSRGRLRKLGHEHQTPFGPIFDADALDRRYGATGALDPDFELAGRQYQLVRTPPVGGHREAAPGAGRDDLERLEQSPKPGRPIRGRNPAVDIAVHDALRPS